MNHRGHREHKEFTKNGIKFFNKTLSNGFCPFIISLCEFFVFSVPSVVKKNQTYLYPMNHKKKHQTSLDVAKNLQRKLALQAGFYDGRFKEKTVKDKKKEGRRKWARKKTDLNNPDKN